MSDHQIPRKPVSRSNSENTAASHDASSSSHPPPPSGPPPPPPEVRDNSAPPPYVEPTAEAAASENEHWPAQNEASTSSANIGSSSTTVETAASPRETRTDVKNAAHHAAVSSQEGAEEAPPPYSDQLGVIESTVEGTQASVADDGRVNINITQMSRTLSVVLAPALRNQVEQAAKDEPLPPAYIPPSLGGEPGKPPPPPMNIVIHVVGSRGDVQPFVALGKVLKETYGHRVRLATHPTFKEFVEENGLEFFSIGGDPAELMAFMVKNPGLMPGFDSLRSGDVGKRRKEIATMVKGCWRSCIETGDGFGVEASDSTVEDWMHQDARASSDLASQPFIADAIIANPPSFAHVHCAEKLGIPLHMMFTMPWSATQQFPHPLANIQSSTADVSMTNYMSYTLVEMLTWQGLGDVINRFRRDSLGLEPVSMMWAPGMLGRRRIPWTYCWSPALIPKPKDWANYISIAGFYFLNLATNFTPEPALAEFLAAGPPPVYIGFGSIVVDDPNAMTKLIFDAVVKTGQRALVSKGWGGFGADQLGIPPGVFMLGNVPHDWLFKRVSCVVHHGGAGTTAAGIACGRPTVIVPFFGDQPFWGKMVARAGAGPDPIAYKDLTADNLAQAIMKALEPSSLERANEMAQKISQEKGSDTGAQDFHRLLKVDELRCALAPSRIGFWRLKRTSILLSGLAATVLAQEGEISFNDLKLHRPRDYETDDGPIDPISGSVSATIGVAGQVMMGVADFPKETLKALRIHPDTAKSKGKGKGKAKEEGQEASTVPQASTSEAGTSSSDMAQHSQTPSTPSSNSPTSLRTRPAPSLSITDHSTESIPSEATLQESHGNTPISSPPSERSSFMSQAMQQRSSSSRPHSPGRCCANGPCSRHKRSNSGAKSPGFSVEAAVGTGKGISRIVGAGLKSPMDVTFALAKGFHNASRLYGEEPRKVGKVTDLESGLKTSGKEFALGLYEGITGIVRDPIRGARKEGAIGFVKGFGKGIAGIALKPSAAALSLPAYTFQGIYKEIAKPFGASVENYIIAARTAQGYDDYLKASEEERADVLQRWLSIKPNIKKKKNPGEDQLKALNQMLEKHREKRKEKEKWRGQDPIASHSPRRFRLHSRSTSGQHGPYLHPASDAATPSFVSSTSSSVALPPNHAELPGSEGNRYSELPAQRLSSDVPWPELHQQPGEHPHRAMTTGHILQGHSPQGHTPTEDEELEAAIHRSMTDTTMRTSRTDEHEDELIERAIQASINELERNPQQHAADEDEDAALHRALTASMEEASRSGATEEEQSQLEEVLRRSITETRREQIRQHRMHTSDSEWDDSSDDASFTVMTPVGGQDTPIVSTAPTSLAPTRSATMEGGDEGEENEEEQLRKALEMSMQVEEEKERERSEEEIVMEYVKRMSLAEEEHRRKMLQGKSGEPQVGEGSGA